MYHENYIYIFFFNMLRYIDIVSCRKQSALTTKLLETMVHRKAGIADAQEYFLLRLNGAIQT